MKRLTAPAVEGFVREYLLEGFANSVPVPWFHREWLELACSDDLNVALAAPRGHAKSTLFNISYSLAAACLRVEPFQLKISYNRKIATEYLRTVKDILSKNQKLIADFDIVPKSSWPMDAEDDFICATADGYEFRMQALGFEQNMRGTTWGTHRPGLVICDDMENPEVVMNKERFEKSMHLFMGTLKPMGHAKTKWRVIGTILGMESLLQWCIDNPAWSTAVYEAVDDDLADESILWPAMYPKEYWKQKKLEYKDNLIQFNMEYRNIAVDMSSGYFQSTDFVETDDRDHYAIANKKLTYYVGVDYAISTKERRDYTVMCVGGLDAEGYLVIADIRKGRWDGKQILDEMFSIQETYNPDRWFVESGAIQKALGAALEIEQRKRNAYLSLEPMVPTKDKASRARSIQSRMRSHAVRFDKRSLWFPDLEAEMIQFPRGRHDDQVDAMAWLGLGLASMVVPLTEEEDEREKVKAMRREMEVTTLGYGGRSAVTGY